MVIPTCGAKASQGGEIWIRKVKRWRGDEGERGWKPGIVQELKCKEESTCLAWLNKL